MTQYKETKRELENILGVKAKNIMSRAENMAEHPISACVISNEKYTIYLFKMSEIKYDIRPERDYTEYDRVSYYAVETGTRLPVSWTHSRNTGDRKMVGTTHHIEYEVINFEDRENLDRKLLFALYNCAHMGHYFTEEHLFD